VIRYRNCAYEPLSPTFSCCAYTHPVDNNRYDMIVVNTIPAPSARLRTRRIPRVRAVFFFLISNESACARPLFGAQGRLVFTCSSVSRHRTVLTPLGFVVIYGKCRVKENASLYLSSPSPLMVSWVRKRPYERATTRRGADGPTFGRTGLSDESMKRVRANYV